MSQMLALTSPTGGGRSVGIVRSQTKATEFFLCRVVQKMATHLSSKALIKYRTATLFLKEKWVLRDHWY